MKKLWDGISMSYFIPTILFGCRAFFFWLFLHRIIIIEPTEKGTGQLVANCGKNMLTLFFYCFTIRAQAQKEGQKMKEARTEQVYSYYDKTGAMVYPSSDTNRLEVVKEVKGLEVVKIVKYGYTDSDGIEYIHTDYTLAPEGQ